MKVEAKITRDWIVRMVKFMAIALVCAAWFGYDGLVGYPKQIERATAYQQLKNDKELEKWPEVAKEHGWSTKDPGEPKTAGDIKEQLVIASIGLVILFLLIGWVLVSSRKVLRADENRIISPFGTEVLMDSVVDLDHRKWEQKGIVYAVYQPDGKGKKRLALDDFKYGGAIEVIRYLENKLGITP